MSERSAAGARRSLVGPVLLLLGIAAVALGQYQFAGQAVAAGAAWCGLGMVLALAAARVLPASSQDRRSVGPAPRLERAEIAFLVIVTAAAAVLRLVALGRWPPGAFFDEAQNVLVAADILRGHFPVFVADYTQMPALFFYLVAATAAVLGKSVVAIRTLSAVLGTLTVPAFYLLARRLFPGAAAVAATVLLAGSRWHLTFSRVGFTGILTPLLEIIAVIALLRAVEGRRRAFAALGLVTGVGLQTYYAFNLFPAVLAATVAAMLWGDRLSQPRSDRRRVLRGLGVSALVAAGVLTPLAVYAVAHLGRVLQRSSTVALWNQTSAAEFPRALWDNCEDHLLMFNFRGDDNPRHNLPGRPMLTAIEGVLLVVGVGLALGRASRWPQAMILAWLGVMLLPGILTIESPQAYRTIGVVPAIYLLVAQALHALREAAQHGSDRPRSWRLGAALVALTLAAATEGVFTYFEFQVTSRRAWGAFNADEAGVARAAKTAPTGFKVWVDPVYYRSPDLDLELGEQAPYGRFLLGEHVPLPRAPGAGRPPGDLFLLEGSQCALSPLFRSVFPEAQLRQHLDPWGDVLFVSVAVPYRPGEPPPGERFAGRGLLAAFYPNESWVGAPTRFRTDPAVFFHFHWDGDGLPGAFTADWAAHLTVPRSGAYAFALLSSGPANLLVDGKIVAAQNHFEDTQILKGSASLGTGIHTLVVRYHHKGFLSLLRCWWQPPGALQPTVIPLADLAPMDQAEYLRLKDSLPVPAPAGRPDLDSGP